jgi:hypothetical protein
VSIDLVAIVKPKLKCPVLTKAKMSGFKILPEDLSFL